MKSSKIAALVPMRHHSQRVPGKNFRLLDGRPLYQHILSTLLRVPEIGQIVVDTDSDEITEGIHAAFPQVTVLRRPDDLRADTIPMNEILLYDTSQVDADLFLQTHSTNPLLRAETLSKAINTLMAVFPAYDSLFSVTALKTRLWDQLGRPINHNPAVLLQTQDLPPVYEENSCIYLFTHPNLVQRRNRIGERPYLFAIDPEEAWDIDEEIDFKLVELMIQANKK